MLTSKALEFCEAGLAAGIPPVVTVLTEGFLSQEELEEVHLEFFGEPLDLRLVCEDNLETEFLKAVRDRKILGEDAWKFCLQEQGRLARMGYVLPLSNILWASGCLENEESLSLYREILGGEAPVAVAVVESQDAAAGVPAIRKFKSHVQRKKAKARKQVAPEDRLSERLQEVVAPRSRSAESDSLQDGEDYIPAEHEAEGAESPEEASMRSSHAPAAGNRNAENSAQPSREGFPTHAGGISDAALQSLLGEFTAAVKSLSRTLQEGKGEEEADSSERKGYRKGKKPLSEREILNVFKKGGTLENAYFSDVLLSEISCPQPITIENCCVENLDLSHVVFEGAVSFENCVFLGKAVFRESAFQKDALFRKNNFLDGADFTKVEFMGNAHFNSAAFRRFVTFNRSNFGAKAIFTHAHFDKGAKFADVKFSRGASFNDTGCEHRFTMEKCHFEQECTFSNSEFGHVAEFSKTTFEKTAKFMGTRFQKNAIFNYAVFQEELHMNGATALGDLSFKWCKFQGLVNLRTLCAEKNVDFNNAVIEQSASFAITDAYFGRLFLTRSQLEGHLESHLQKKYGLAQKEYGLLKNNFREINEYDREDWAYLMEKRMERQGIQVKGARSAFSRFFNWLALDLACGYGTRPFHIFLTSMLVLALFALFYQTVGSQFQPPEGSAIGEGSTAIGFWEAVQVSFRTFTNAEVGGRQLHPRSWVEYVVMFESFLGFFIMTVLVVTFSRKVIR